MTLLVPLALMFFSYPAVYAGSACEYRSPEKIITVTVNEAGSAIIGRDTLTMDGLIVELTTRLWKSYLGTGKMYDAIRLEFTNGVLSEVKVVARESIHDAQKKTLMEICLEKYKKRFDDLDSRQQAKIQKQFPVLFQADF